MSGRYVSQRNHGGFGFLNHSGYLEKSQKVRTRKSPCINSSLRPRLVRSKFHPPSKTIIVRLHHFRRS